MDLPHRVRLGDLVFPDQTNHHGSMFGGACLAVMDKVAFLAAARLARRGFVTASIERTDFKSPVSVGEFIDVAGQVRSVGRTSMIVQVSLWAENLLSGARRLTTQGDFTMVAVDRKSNKTPLPPVPDYAPEPQNITRMAELVFPGDTDHRGFLFGGRALNFMEKAAFIAASRHARSGVVMAALNDISFAASIHVGEMIEISARVTSVGRSSMRVAVRLCAEDLKTGERRQATIGEFVMVALGKDGRPTPAPPLSTPPLKEEIET